MFQRANDVSLEVYSDVGDVAEMLLLNSRFMFALFEGSPFTFSLNSSLL